MTVRSQVAEIPDKRMNGVIQYIDDARAAGLNATDAPSDLLIEALIRAWVEMEQKA